MYATLNGNTMKPQQNDIPSFLKKHLKLSGNSRQYAKYLNRPGSPLAEGFTSIELDAGFGKIEQPDPGFHTVALVLAGEATINGESRLPAGHLTIIPAGLSFGMAGFSADFRAGLLLFTPAFIQKGLVRNEVMGDLLSMEDSRLPGYPLFPRLFDDVQAKFLGIAAELDSEGPYRSEMVRLYLMQVLYSFNRVCEACLLRARNRDNRKFQLVQEFRKLVNRHFHDTRTVAEYASMLNITPKYLSECTQACYHRPAVKLIHERLLLESELLLDYSGMSIKEIVHTLHFSTPSHFARFFKSNKGITPAEYRRKP